MGHIRGSIRKGISVTEKEIVVTFYKALIKSYIESLAQFWTTFFCDQVYRKVIEMTRRMETLFYGRKLNEHSLVKQSLEEDMFAF